VVKRIIPCVLLAASGLAVQPPVPGKAVCNAASRGRFWPEIANSDRRIAGKLSQCGVLEMCTMSRWRYKWRPVTVNIRQLGKTPQGPSPECAALMAEAIPRER
jgi:hypothetical protein